MPARPRPLPICRRSWAAGVLLALAAVFAPQFSLAAAEMLGETQSVETVTSASARGREETGQHSVRNASAAIPVTNTAPHVAASSRVERQLRPGHCLTNGLRAPLRC
jgi:hypothetical protein